MTPDLAALAEWLQKKGQGAVPPDATPAAPPDSAAPPPPPDAPPPPSGLEGLMSQYQALTSPGGGYSADALAKAQAADVANIEGNRLGKQMGNAAGLMISNPGAVQIPDAVPMAVKNFAMRRELAKENLGTQMQMLQLDPQSPIAQAKITALNAAGIKLPPGTSPLVADSYLAALKSGADVSKLQAEIDATRAGIPLTQAQARAATAQATGAEIENSPASPPMIAMAGKLGLKLDPTVTNKQARDLIDASAKAQGIQLDWSRLDLERFAKQVEMARYASEHPNAPVPGFQWVGPGAPPDRNSEPVKGLADKVAGHAALKGTLDEMRAIYDRSSRLGHVVGADATRLDTLQKALFAGMPDKEAELRKGQLPDATGFASGAFRPEKMHAAMDALLKASEEGVHSFAKSRNFAPQGAKPGAPGEEQPKGTAPVRKFTRDASGNLVEAT